jgi:hypothetical protein
MSRVFGNRKRGGSSVETSHVIFQLEFDWAHALPRARSISDRRVKVSNASHLTYCQEQGRQIYVFY